MPSIKRLHSMTTFYNFTPKKKPVNLSFSFPKRAFGYQPPLKNTIPFFFQAHS